MLLYDKENMIYSQSVMLFVQSLPEVRSQLKHLFGVFKNVGDILFLLLLFHLLFAQVRYNYSWQKLSYFHSINIFNSFSVTYLIVIALPVGKTSNIACHRAILTILKLFLADWHYALCWPDDHTSKCR